jgi:hypothetical protein
MMCTESHLYLFKIVSKIEVRTSNEYRSNLAAAAMTHQYVEHRLVVTKQMKLWI